MRIATVILLFISSLALGQQQMLLRTAGAVGVDDTLALWLDFGDPASYTTNNDTLTAVTDKGVYAYTIDIADKPIFTDGGLDSMGVYFDGVDDDLGVNSSTGKFNFLHNGESTIFVVVEIVDNPGVLERVICNWTLASANRGFAFGWDDGTGTDAVFLSCGDGSAPSTPVSLRDNSAFTPDSTHLFSIKFDPANGTQEDRALFQVENATQDTYNSNTSSPTAGDALYDLHFMQNAVNTGYSEGWLYEVRIYKGLLTAAEETSVRNELATKWGF